MRKMQYYMKLKDYNRLNLYMKQTIQKLELQIYEERFYFENEIVEVYKIGPIEECKKFIENINDRELQKEFEVIKIDEKQL